MRWSDFDNNYLTVSRGLDRKKRAPGLKTPGSHRNIYTNDKLSNALRQQHIWKKENQILFGKHFIINDYIFTHENGSPITSQQLYIHFKRFVAGYNKSIPENKSINNSDDYILPITSLYKATRHSFGTNAIEGGAEVVALSKRPTMQNTYILAIRRNKRF